MKRIEAYLSPHRLTAVIHQLHALPRFPGLTVLDAHGQGHGRGAGGHYAYDEGSMRYLDRRLLVVLCEDADAQSIAQLIAATAHTGNKGDGIVVVTDVSEVLRIRDVTSAVAPVVPSPTNSPKNRGEA